MNEQELYEVINAAWVKDSADLGSQDKIMESSLRVYTLHQKYWEVLIRCGRMKNKLMEEYTLLKSAKLDYYNGDMDLTEIKERGWHMPNKRLVKSEAARMVETDPEIVTYVKRIANMELVIDYCESVIKIIEKVSFNIKNVIDFMKYNQGMHV